jgi:hypothetical protein
MSNEQIPPFWSHYSNDIIFPCISWEVCGCGLCAVQYWPDGKYLSQYCECIECGSIATTVTILATSN